MALMTSNARTLEQLRKISTPVGDRRWVPVPHAQLVDITTQVCEDLGLDIGETRFGTSKDNHQMFGTLDIVNRPMLNNRGRLQIGLRNSTNQSLSAGICIGAKVIVCDNLMFKGEIIEFRKHTTTILNDLGPLIVKAVTSYGAQTTELEKLAEILGNVKISDEMASHTIMRIATRPENEIIAFKDARDVWAEWQGADEGKKRFNGYDAPNTAWELYNHFTWVQKSYQNNMVVANERGMALTNYFVKEFAPALLN